MINKPVLFIDSGIGGLLYCRDFLKHNPEEEICYLADTKNFPYGTRKKEEIFSILVSLIEKLLKTINPKIIVLACNTATVSALDLLRQHFQNMLFVGTVPAVKPAVNASKTGKIGVLGTARTIEDSCSLNLVKDNEDNGKSHCEIFPLAAPELVKFVELNFEKAGEKEKNEIVKKYIEIFRAEEADTLVLGCTHFLYLLEEFRNEASPDIQVFDSLDGITKRIEFLLDENDGRLRTENGFNPSYGLIITGAAPPGSIWINRTKEFGFKLILLNEIYGEYLNSYGK